MLAMHLIYAILHIYKNGNICDDGVSKGVMSFVCQTLHIQSINIHYVCGVAWFWMSVAMVNVYHCMFVLEFKRTDSVLNWLALFLAMPGVCYQI